MAAMLLVLAACNPLRTEPEKIEIAFPQQWRGTEASDVAVTAEGALPQYNRDWWKDFNDPGLNALVEQVLARNNDLTVAALTLRTARLQLGLARWAQVPILSGSASVGRSFDLNNDTSAATFGTTGSVSYEADIWRRLSDAKRAAKFEVGASAEDYESLRQTLINTAATLYWQIALNAQKIYYGELSLGYTQRTHDFAVVNHDAGAVSGLDVAQANQSLAAQKAALESLRQEAVELRNAMAVLLGLPPGSALTTNNALPTSELPEVQAGIPADIISRRPDIRAARLRLQGALLGVDITSAAILPGISLTGSYGTSSVLLSDILLNPAGFLGASISLPFLQWRQQQLSIEVSKVQYEAAVVNFRQTIYKSLGEVDNALSARQQLEKQRALLEESLNEAVKAEQIYTVQYEAGAEPLRFMLDAQEATRQSRTALLDNYYQRLLNHATLCLSLGGSVANTAPAPISAPPVSQPAPPVPATSESPAASVPITPTPVAEPVPALPPSTLLPALPMPAPSASPTSP